MGSGRRYVGRHSGEERRLPVRDAALQRADDDAAQPGPSTATLMWKGNSRSALPDGTEGLHSLITTPVIAGDYIYGVGSYGELRGLDARTGERLG